MLEFIKTIVNALKVYIDEKFVISRPNWNQNDKSADNYIENRTHWSYGEVEEVILEPQSTNNTKLVFKNEIIIGETYKVTLGNETYIFTAWGSDKACLGDGDFLEIPKGEFAPFLIYGDVLHYYGEECTINITRTYEKVHKLDQKYLDLPTNLATSDYVENSINLVDNNKMDKWNPVGTGSFSMNRKNNTTIGNYSHAEGYYTTASGDYSHAEGYYTEASGDYSHAEGNNATASGDYSHAEGYVAKASGDYSHAEGQFTIASSIDSHAEGHNTIASGINSHAEGYNTEASGYCSHSEGNLTTATGSSSHSEGIDTKASGKAQHVQGKYNINDVDAEGNALNTYAHIVGNGTSDTDRSNAHTLDWSGNAWYQGSVEATALILSSPNGTRFQITVGDDGVLTASEIEITE